MSDPLSGEVSRLVAAGAELLGVDPGPVAPTVLDGYLGEGYAVPSAGSTEALRLLAGTEGVVADPVYTAKALHALCAESWDGPVVFWHTGGTPALFSEAGGLDRW
jgi:1-aminocyclopropane-1-carboxylate deaminase/D-cysteine desulfhydrase-like pyridoxal-dependent ACC family enzyme